MCIRDRYDAASAIKELKEGVEVFSKLHEVDLVTEADLKSEEILINAITSTSQMMELFLKNRKQLILTHQEFG